MTEKTKQESQHSLVTTSIAKQVLYTRPLKSMTLTYNNGLKKERTTTITQKKKKKKLLLKRS